ncbi:ChbG/HpnK family deacetylase [Lacticaseibacillus daqingensis]|uniref:ChbG/HpnK family deacetylase n=1 Tax=Lacticaseibacillus daqingensis TaxID=2486014 RepID=UPI000F77753A|nr:ChbG/HpnK family deacetylase [Lacticaseibacillus daqingensis]
MKLIINGDDFGYDRGINLGIIDAFRMGVLTSTTLMVTMPGTEDAVKLKEQYPDLGVGLHLNLSLGRPMTTGKTLVSASGDMIKPRQLPADHHYDLNELREEVHAQYQRYLDLVGEKPDHIDSHLFSTDEVPEIKQAAIELAEEVDLPLRHHRIGKYSPVTFISHHTYDLAPDLDYIYDRFEDITQSEYVEIMTHPGYVDQYLLDHSSYNTQRAGELDFLTGQTFGDFLRDQNVDLITYGQVPKL